MTDRAGDAGPLLFDLVRFWSKRGLTEQGGVGRQGRLVLVAEAVQASGRHGPVTINTIASEIGIDQSGVSRLVQTGVERGYFAISFSSDDGRQRQVSLTPEGTAMLDQSRAWQSQVFVELTESWSADERASFGKSLQRLLDASRRRRS